jgi:protein-S-isoprenylcysteine O-methyltransferase Ste14
MNMEQKRKILPPVYLLLSLVVMTALHFFAPIARVIPAPWSFVGDVLIVVGIAITAIAAVSFKRAGTPVVPFERSTLVVTGGLYRLTRNPMYLGLLVALIGAAVLFGTVSAFLPIPVFVWIIQTRFIRGEERFLEELFGEQYLAYKKKVRRWI